MSSDQPAVSSFAHCKEERMQLSHRIHGIFRQSWKQAFKRGESRWNWRAHIPITGQVQQPHSLIIPLSMLWWLLSSFIRGKKKRSQPPGGKVPTAAFALRQAGFYALLGAALSYFATTSTWNTAQPILGTCWTCSGIGNDQVGYIQHVQDAHSRLQAKGNSLIRPGRVLSHAGREKGKLERILALHGNEGKRKNVSLLRASTPVHHSCFSIFLQQH